MNDQDRAVDEAKTYAKWAQGRLQELEAEALHSDSRLLLKLAQEDIDALLHRVNVLRTIVDQIQAEADEAWHPLDQLLHFIVRERVPHDPELRHLLDTVFPEWGCYR